MCPGSSYAGPHEHPLSRSWHRPFRNGPHRDTFSIRCGDTHLAYVDPLSKSSNTPPLHLYTTIMLYAINLQNMIYSRKIDVKVYLEA